MVSIKSERLAVVVENEWLVRLDSVDALVREGWQMLELTTGESTPALLESGRKIDLLITDIWLGGQISGWDVAERFRRADSQVAVIYYSETPPNKERQVPASIFLAKPYSQHDLIEAAKKAMPSLNGP